MVLGSLSMVVVVLMSDLFVLSWWFVFLSVVMYGVSCFVCVCLCCVMCSCSVVDSVFM